MADEIKNVEENAMPSNFIHDFIDEDIPSLQAFLDGIRAEIGLYLNEIP